MAFQWVQIPPTLLQSQHAIQLSESEPFECVTKWLKSCRDTIAVNSWSLFLTSARRCGVETTRTRTVELQDCVIFEHKIKLNESNRTENKQPHRLQAYAWQTEKVYRIKENWKASTEETQPEKVLPSKAIDLIALARNAPPYCRSVMSSSSFICFALFVCSGAWQRMCHEFRGRSQADHHKVGTVKTMDFFWRRSISRNYGLLFQQCKSWLPVRRRRKERLGHDDDDGVQGNMNKE